MNDGENTAGKHRQTCNATMPVANRCWKFYVEGAIDPPAPTFFNPAGHMLFTIRCGFQQLVLKTNGIAAAFLWFLPAVKPHDFPTTVSGWQAFRLAACAIWPCEGLQFDTVQQKELAGVSLITTLLFVLCSTWLALRGSQSLRRWSAWDAAAAFVFNMHWIVIFGPQRSQLAVGYFVWLSSFLLLAIGLFVSSRSFLGSKQLGETGQIRGRQ